MLTTRSFGAVFHLGLNSSGCFAAGRADAHVTGAYRRGVAEKCSQRGVQPGTMKLFLYLLLLVMANQTRMAWGSAFSRSVRYWHDGVGVDYTPNSLVCDGTGAGF